MLSIRDLDRSGDESGYDSDPDANHNGPGTIEKQHLLFMGSTGGSAAAPFSSIKGRTRTKGSLKGKSPGLEILTRKGLASDDEVAEAISPGGHVIKRRARSRPVSAELLETVQSMPILSTLLECLLLVVVLCTYTPEYISFMLPYSPTNLLACFHMLCKTLRLVASCKHSLICSCTL